MLGRVVYHSLLHFILLHLIKVLLHFPFQLGLFFEKFLFFCFFIPSYSVELVVFSLSVELKFIIVNWVDLLNVSLS